MTSLRRTKIVATLGPSTNTAEKIESIIEAGVNVVRLNFSHGSHQEHINRARLVRDVASRLGKTIGILGDLQGPKIRITKFIDRKITLNDGDHFVLDAGLANDQGTQERIGLTYKDLPQEKAVKTDSVLLLDDGKIILRVLEKKGREIHTVVEHGGELSDSKGINLKGGGLSAGALTQKDKEDILAAKEIDVDFLAVSFPRNAGDIHEARELLKAAGSTACIVAKIERAEAIKDLDEAVKGDENTVIGNIVDASDAIMVARGDLGVEIGDPALPEVQKKLIKLARNRNKVVITATQMMETMISSRTPTRAEVFDVANAVIDGTDAVMLSGETAAGKYPGIVVSAMRDICVQAEQAREVRVSDHRVNSFFKRIDEGIAMAAMFAANHMGIRGIAAMTETGSTVLWMSRISSGIPIYALTEHEATLRKVTLYRGVYPVKMDKLVKNSTHHQAECEAVSCLRERCGLKDPDRIIVTHGDLMGRHGGTNILKIIRVGDIYYSCKTGWDAVAELDKDDA